MEITIYLNNGMQFNVTVEDYDADGFAKMLNNPQLQVVTLGTVVLSKHAVMMVLPQSVNNVPAE